MSRLADTMREGESIRVAILDPEQLLRETLSAALEKGGMQVVASSAEPVRFLSRLRESAPHVAILDLQPGQAGLAVELDGLSLLQRLHDFYPGVKSLVLSRRHEPALMERCLRLGAAGYLCKLSASIGEVVEAVRCVARDEQLTHSGLMPFSLSPPAGGEEGTAEALSRLTKREREVLGYIAAGADNLKIAACLGITERTVKAHITSIYKKLGPENRTQLAVLACQLGVERPAAI